MSRPAGPAGGFLLAAAVLITGCSVGHYDADYAEALRAFEEQAPFAVLQAGPAEVGSGSFRLRLPQGFLPIALPPASDGEAGSPIDPNRLRPPFLPDFPGYDQTFERRFAVGNVEYPCSLAIGVLTAAGPARRQVETMIVEKAQEDESFTGQKPAWEDREVVAAEGGPTAWRVLSLSGQQVFETVLAGSEQYKRHAGVCECWLSAGPEPDRQLLLVWRYPDEVVEHMPVAPAVLTETVARTVAVTANEEDDETEAEKKVEPPAASQDASREEF